MIDHDDHDLHGPMLMRMPDGSVELDEDCGCPLDCEGCSVDGIVGGESRAADG